MNSKDITKSSGSNFYYSFYALPKEQRQALFRIYAFSRVIDDVADSDEPVEKKREGLARWRGLLDLVYENLGTRNEYMSPDLIQELAESIQKFQIPQGYFLDLIAGVEMDLTKVRYENFRDLEGYCYHVAGTVGLLCNSVFGSSTERAHNYAVTLGTAFQLTNILRDLKKDGERERIYIPKEDLDRFGYTEEDLLNGKVNQNFYDLMDFECKRAERYYSEAHSWLSKKERRPLIAAEIMEAIYSRILKEIRKRPERVFVEKVALSKPKKVALALGVWVRARFS